MNAKKELLREIKKNDLNVWNIICAKVIKGSNEFILKKNHTNEEFINFIYSLDLEYDNGYGEQELYGIVWFKDSWLERKEYYGSEWWEFKKYPEIPEELLGK